MTKDIQTSIELDTPHGHAQVPFSNEARKDCL